MPLAIPGAAAGMTLYHKCSPVCFPYLYMVKRIYYSTLCLLLSACSILIFSCANEAAENKPITEDANTTADEPADTTTMLLGCKHSVADSAGTFFRDSLIEFDQLDTTRIPRFDANRETLLLQARGYHGDEITNTMKKTDWWELYDEDGQYHLMHSNPEFKQVFDGIVDEDTTQKTGVEVAGNHDDAFFFAKIPGMTEGSVPTIQLDTNVILPGTNHLFKFNGVHYRIYATAYYQHRDDEDEIDYIANYKLYMERDDNGTITKQLIMARPLYDSYYSIRPISVLADIDRDGLPDLIMDVSNNYNGSQPTLFLSGSAAEGKLLQAVAMHSSVGC